MFASPAPRAEPWHWAWGEMVQGGARVSLSHMSGIICSSFLRPCCHLQWQMASPRLSVISPLSSVDEETFFRVPGCGKEMWMLPSAALQAGNSASRESLVSLEEFQYSFVYFTIQPTSLSFCLLFGKSGKISIPHYWFYLLYSGRLLTISSFHTP